ncbi:hypothetical protein KWH75_13065 [Morganella morganii]|uniref:hypothetical protein n=1 Tax=Morganella morganii TaxID=582 RepID=UPI0021D31902|nr:hypothetical protein [Morganella morganii]MCU6237990.1 hypothetical protein [Morganella morganii]
MAIKIMMENPKTGEIVTGFYGYSWTTLLFGAFPSLFRKDFMTFIGVFVVACIISFLTMGIGGLFISIVWSFMYNKYYTTNLLRKGSKFAGTPTENEMAARSLKLRLNEDNCITKQGPIVG